MNHISCDKQLASGNHLSVSKRENDKEEDDPIVTFVTRDTGKTIVILRLVREEVWIILLRDTSVSS